MELQLSQQQMLLKNTIEKVCKDYCKLEILREIEDTKKGTIWKSV